MKSSDTSALVSRGYDLWAATYDGLDNPLVAMSARALTDASIPFASARVAELGCGTGRNASYVLAQGAARYVGIDASAGMLAQARARGLPASASFVVGDVSQGPAPELLGQFEVVLVCLVLEHVQDVAPVFSTARKLLCEGGVLVVHELDAERHAAGVQAHFQHQGAEIRLPSFAHSAEELVTAAQACGLSVLRAERRSPSQADCAQSPKLGRYLGRPLLIELVAQR